MAASAGWIRLSTKIPFIVWILIFASSGYFLPGLYTWNWSGWQPQDAIQPLVQLIMFGMGITLTFSDFSRIFKQPRSILIGVICQFVAMPFLAWCFVTLFGLQGEVAAGLVLIGSCPGGVSSNVICYIAGANVPLSVTLTACSTLASPVATPLAMKFYAGQHIEVEFLPMMNSILLMILVPVLLGLIVNRLASRQVRVLKEVLPAVAMLSICLIIAITIALAGEDLKTVGLALFAAAVCHNTMGYVLGYGTAWVAGMPSRDCRTMAIEVGIQNGGMATGLALHVLKSPLMALGAAVFGPWSAVSSSILAAYWQRREPIEPADATTLLKSADTPEPQTSNAASLSVLPVSPEIHSPS